MDSSCPADTRAEAVITDVPAPGSRLAALLQIETLMGRRVLHLGRARGPVAGLLRRHRVVHAYLASDRLEPLCETAGIPITAVGAGLMGAC
ncbi:hypothetical protein V6N00_13885 [Tersicoccus sp. MR15.9]|uniref:hypothetical protein n=1 Tax=Tersicoccus mangrovi TaxID=3121635 RepID=UPI002FE69729